jgi:hypothetical protein
MMHIFGFERSQLLLLPEAVDNYVGADNPVRFIDAFVDGLDLAAAGFSCVEPKSATKFCVALDRYAGRAMEIERAFAPAARPAPCCTNPTPAIHYVPGEISSKF